MARTQQTHDLTTTNSDMIAVECNCSVRRYKYTEASTIRQWRHLVYTRKLSLFHCEFSANTWFWRVNVRFSTHGISNTKYVTRLAEPTELNNFTQVVSLQ
jgi:hypothetical protein